MTNLEATSGLCSLREETVLKIRLLWVLSLLLVGLLACGSPREGVELRVDAQALEGIATVEVLVISSTLKSGEPASCSDFLDGTYKVDKANFDISQESSVKINSNETQEVILSKLSTGERMFLALAYESVGGAAPTIALFGCKQERIRPGQKTFVSIGLSDFQGKQ